MNLIPIILCLALVSCRLESPRTAPIARGAPQTFELVEQFGVSHPDQIVFFEMNRKADEPRENLVDGLGQPAPFQVMSDSRLALRTDLPAGATKTWRWAPGKAPVAPGVKVVETPEGYEITNELIGVRVPKAPTDLSKTPAPIQGLRFQDGTWTALGPNSMSRPAKTMTVEFLERGPLVLRVKVAYTYDKGPLHSYLNSPDFPDVPAGEGLYTTTIELQAGQPSVTFEEECETDVSYKVEITDGLTPDRAQYRGHHGTSTEAGMDPDGAVYSYKGNQRHDALVNLRFDGKGTNALSHTTYPFMSHWDIWGVDTGFYWQLYDSRANGSDNLFGIFAGPASRLISPGNTGVSFDAGTVEGRPHVGLQVRFERLMPTQRYTTHMRFGWGIFLGRKSADLKPPMEVQGVNKQMNLHSGVNLNTISRLPATFPDPKDGYGNLYAPVRAWKGVADALREEKLKGEKTLFNQQYTANPYLGTLLEFWADPTAVAAKKAADAVNGRTTSYLDTLVNGEGIYEHSRHYFMGASGMASDLIWMDQLLASDQLPPEEKAKLKRSAALYATALWDHDVAPMQANSGMNWGPANMASMWCGTRYNYTLFLAVHPDFKTRVETVRKDALTLLYDYTCESGACSAGSHYTEASMTPILNLLQQMQMRGVVDAFATEKRLRDYAEWEMQLSTPPEVRFGGLRKFIAVGDAATEQNVRVGQLGTGFAKSNPGLSARLMGMWKAMGNPQNNFFGASLLKVDPALPSVSPKLGDARFDGWMSVLRHGWETPDESAVFFINGDRLTDHRHNDQGEVIVYALGAPLSLDFGSMYAPRSSGGLMHSIALPEAWLKRAWDADHVPLDVPSSNRSSWWNTQPLPFLLFRESASTGARFSPEGSQADAHWQRTVRNLHPDPARPVIAIEDVFTGKEVAGKPVVSTFNLMAQGAVVTPSGAVTPVERTHTPDQNSTPEKLPSAGPPFPLPAGANKLGFTGQWLIDWDLYAEAAAPMQALIGNWGHQWHPSGEQGQFHKAQGRPFEERQHILRLRGEDRIRVLILPRRKSDTRTPLTAKRQQEAWLIRGEDFELRLSDHGSVFQSAVKKVLTAFDAEPAEGFGVKLTGGPGEVTLAATNGRLVICGDTGPRSVELPEGWSLRTQDLPAGTKVRPSGRAYQVDAPGPIPVELMLERK